MKEGPYVYSDVTDSKYMHSIIVDNSIDWVVHYSALLSAAAEDNLQRALEVGPGSHSDLLIRVCIALY